MNFISKGNIRIFPSSNRGVDSGQFGNNFATEYNLSSIVNKLLSQYIGGKNGFLISSYPEDDDELTEDNKKKPAEFNIAGYFIEVSSWKDLIEVATSDSNKFTSEDSTPTSPPSTNESLDLPGATNPGEGGGSSFVQFYTLSNNIYARLFLYPGDSVDKSYTYMEGKDDGDTSGGGTKNIGTENEESRIPVTLQLLESDDGISYRLCQSSKLSFTNFRLDDGDLDSTPFKN